jgi:hypothetical protein
MIGCIKKLRYLIGKDNDFKCELITNRIYSTFSLNANLSAISIGSGIRSASFSVVLASTYGSKHFSFLDTLTLSFFHLNVSPLSSARIDPFLILIIGKLNSPD